MRLSPTAFNAFLGGIGQEFLWRRAFACPNINTHSGAAEYNCQVCLGKGWVWDQTGIVGIAGVSNQGVQRKFSAMGLYEPGDLLMSIPSDSPLYGVGQMDRVAALNSRTRFSETLAPGQFRLTRSAPCVDRVMWLNGDKTALIDGPIPVVAVDGTLSWPNGDGPPSGLFVSVSGSFMNEFYCFQELPANRMEHAGALLPRKLHLRKFDLFGR